MSLSKLRKKYSYVLPSTPDPRDHLYVAGSAREKDVSLKAFRGQILDQGSWGSCTGHGTAGMLHSFYRRMTGFEIDFNPYWIWYWVRKTYGWEGLNAGGHPRDIFKTLVSKGVCEERVWRPRNFTDAPPKLSDDQVIRFKGYKRLNVDYRNFDNTKNDLYWAIGQEQLPIGINMTVYASFERHEGRSSKLRLPGPNDPIVGCHWAFVDEVRSDGITLVNSWGRDWGSAGTFLMPWEYVRKCVIEAWCLDPELT
jgi:hypothetical protein